MSDSRTAMYMPVSVSTAALIIQPRLRRCEMRYSQFASQADLAGLHTHGHSKFPSRWRLTCQWTVCKWITWLFSSAAGGTGTPRHLLHSGTPRNSPANSTGGTVNVYVGLLAWISHLYKAEGNHLLCYFIRFLLPALQFQSNSNFPKFVIEMAVISWPQCYTYLALSLRCCGFWNPHAGTLLPQTHQTEGGNNLVSHEPSFQLPIYMLAFWQWHLSQPNFLLIRVNKPSWVSVLLSITIQCFSVLRASRHLRIQG